MDDQLGTRGNVSAVVRLIEPLCCWAAEAAAATANTFRCLFLCGPSFILGGLCSWRRKGFYSSYCLTYHCMLWDWETVKPCLDPRWMKIAHAGRFRKSKASCVMAFIWLMDWIYTWDVLEIKTERDNVSGETLLRKESESGTVKKKMAGVKVCQKIVLQQKSFLHQQL